MSAALPWSAALILMALTAGGYALATIGMKMTVSSHGPMPIAIIVLGLAGAALAEIVLLRHATLPLVYLGIIVTETILVLGYAAWFQDELTMSQLGGAFLVLTGFALVLSQG